MAGSRERPREAIEVVAGGSHGDGTSEERQAVRVEAALDHALARPVRELVIVRVLVQVPSALGDRRPDQRVLEQKPDEIVPRPNGVRGDLERAATVHRLVTIDGEEPRDAEAATAMHDNTMSTADAALWPPACDGEYTYHR